MITNPSLSYCKSEFQKFEEEKMMIEEIPENKFCEPLIIKTGFFIIISSFNLP